MSKQTVTTGSNPLVLIRVDGNLAVKPSDELDVTVKSENPEDVHLEQNGDEVSVVATTDCTVYVPEQAKVRVERVSGEASFKALAGELEIQSIEGNLSLRSIGLARIERVAGNVDCKAMESELEIQSIEGNLSLRSIGSARIERVEGEFLAKHVEGDLTLGGVAGNVTVRDLEGVFVVRDEISGNLSLDDVEGDVNVKVAGNASLRLDPQSDQEYVIKAAGNLVCRLPDDASVKVEVSQAKRVTIDSRPQGLSETADAPHTWTLGDGEAKLQLSADGNVLIANRAPDWEMETDFDVDFGAEFDGMAESIGEQVARQMEAQMAALEQQLNAQMGRFTTTARAISPEEAERIAQRARAASERAAAQAQERMHRAQEKLERKLAAARQRAEQRAQRAERRAQRSETGRHAWRFEWHTTPKPPTPPTPPEPPSEPVSDDERLVILHMLEQKQISLEEADKLLSALEGDKGA